VEDGMLWRNGCDGKVLRCGAGKRHQHGGLYVGVGVYTDFKSKSPKPGNLICTIGPMAYGPSGKPHPAPPVFSCQLKGHTVNCKGGVI
jgi:hypothetical protein